MFKESVALITGGASGIGSATVEQLLENDIKKVYIADINAENGENIVKTLKSQYGNDRVNFLKLDVTNYTEFQNVFETIIKDNGRLDIFLNNAGIFVGDKILDINVGGVFNGLILAMKFMKKGSKIINTASTAGLVGCGEFPEYIASKHAVIGFTRSFSTNYWYDKTEISVMAICPGLTKTPLIDIPNKEENKDLINFINVVNCGEFPEQSVESVAKSMVKILKVGTNGSFWLAESNKLFELELPWYHNLIKNEVSLTE